MNWKYFKEYIPYLSGLIILLGLVRQMVYYGHYNIEIQNYIGVSELLLAWMDESLLFVLLVLPIFILVKISAIHTFPKHRKQKVFKIFRGVAIILLVTIILAFVFKFSLMLEAFYLSFFLITLYPIIIIKFEYFFTTREINKTIFHFIYFACSIIFLMSWLTNQSIKIVDEGNYSGTKIYTNDTTYVSDNTHYYIGKTEKFYFIYDRNKKSTLVVPEREVSKFDLKGGVPLYDLNKFVRNDSSIIFKLFH